MKFYLYPFCPIINGENHSVILNLQSGSYTKIPNSLCEILSNQKKMEFDVDQIVRKYGNKSIIESYFNFLFKNKIGLFSDKKLKFKPLNTDWEFPGTLRTLIISISNDTTFDINKVIYSCLNLGCVNIELRLDHDNSFILLKNILEEFKDSSLANLICFINQKVEFLEFESILNITSKLVRLTICDSKIVSNDVLFDNLVYLTEKMDENISSMHIDKYFIDIQFYLESLKYNPFLNKKVYISPEGFIKNETYFDEDFGNVMTDSLLEIVSSSSFQEKWKINNDQIIELKNNPMRYSILMTSKLLKIDSSKYSMVN